ncbi:MAG: type II secretion system protein, partial [Limisphaerales bacterium]
QLAGRHNKSPRIECVNNLMQIGLAYRIWEGDHNNKYPMQVSVTDGGAMELIATGNVAACFQVMSNELDTPKILVCPMDTSRIAATNFENDFNNSHISYFAGVDVTNEMNPRMILSGDDNFEIGDVSVKSGLLEFSTNAPIAWTSARHKYAGNIGFADGSVQEVTTEGLQNALRQTGVATNRLAIP